MPFRLTICSMSQNNHSGSPNPRVSNSGPPRRSVTFHRESACTFFLQLTTQPKQVVLPAFHISLRFQEILKPAAAGCHNDINGYIIGSINIIIAHKQGKKIESANQNSKPEDNNQRGKKLNILNNHRPIY